MKLATVVLSFTEKKHLDECLTSLEESELEGIEHKIIVVDNKKENLGFAAGNNKGIKQALEWGAEAVMLLNDDTKADSRAVLFLARRLFQTGRTGVVVPKIYFYPGFEFHQSRYQKKDRGKVIWYAGGRIDWKNILGLHQGVDEVDFGQFKKSREVEFATGCCLMAKSEVFQKVGLFDERYFLYLEDLDFSVRVAQAGYRMMFVPEAVIWHKNAQSSGVGSGLHHYFFTRNRLLFGMSHASLRTKLALVRESGRWLLSGSAWQRRGVRDFYLRKFGRGSFRFERGLSKEHRKDDPCKR